MNANSGLAHLCVAACAPLLIDHNVNSAAVLCSALICVQPAIRIMNSDRDKMGPA